ncbi:MAG: HPP family protein [Methylococcales bacterium]|nr:HPP family protein [Methylococcales bacterium]
MMMTIKQLIGFVRTDPVNLTIKAKLLAVVAGFIAILIVAWLTQTFSSHAVAPLMVASMGASAVLLFILPNSPLSQPWSLVGGHLLSATVGVLCAQLISDIAWASASATGISILIMLLFRCLHPPAAATALTPILVGTPVISLGYSFVMFPVGLNVLVILCMAIILNRWLLGNRYPIMPSCDTKGSANSEPEQLMGISDTDLKQALKNMDTFMDVSLEDLSKLLTDAEKNSFKRFKGNITCADIMVRDVLTVEYGTEVEEAWKMMLKDRLKAMPVLDRSRRVIGIITWADFLKFIDLNAHQSIQASLHAFIRRTPDISTNKPESVGHIMTAPVTTLLDTTHIVELIPLMSYKGIRQIPIVNNENRLVGMVYQAQLCIALYDEQLATIVKNQSVSPVPTQC